MTVREKGRKGEANDYYCRGAVVPWCPGGGITAGGKWEKHTGDYDRSADDDDDYVSLFNFPHFEAPSSSSSSSSAVQ